MRSIWTAPGGDWGFGCWVIGDGFIYRSEISLGQYYITVKDDQPFPVRALCTIVATLAWSAVFLGIIMQIKDVCVFVANILACLYRPVFHNDYFEILKCLESQAFE